MTIGEALAEARHQAGLTVDELSERTRIREAVIRGIEQDDYAACGGDIYVRGYVRAIAGAVGIDAQPLIRDFDAGRASAAAVAPNEFAQDLAGSAMTTLPQPVLVAEPAPEPPEPAPEPPEAAPEPEPEPEPPTVVDLLPVAGDPEPALAYPEPTRADLELTLADLEFVLADPEFPTEDPAIAVPAASPVTVSSPVTVASPITTASAVTAARPVEPGQPSAWRARLRGRRWVTGVAILVVIALAIAGFSGSRIVTHLRHPAAAGNAATGQQKAPSRASHGPGANTPGAASKPKGNPAQRAPHALVHWLPILRVTSFGPDGTADGDNPQGAQWAIASHSPSPWQTDWYASPAFGMLKPGTGLLLDMGKTVTISSLRIDLSPYRGADLQLRVGRTASDLRVAARADDVGGTVRLKLLSPRRARYVLIWFTLLPPDGAGTYQESVYRIVVNGRT